MSFMAMLPALVAAGGSLAGGLMNQSAQRWQRNAFIDQSRYTEAMDTMARERASWEYDINREFQERTNAQQLEVGNYWAGRSEAFAREQAAQAQANRVQDLALQREFAQSGVQWRADDARAAGLHPLAALGAQLASASPVSVGSQSFSSPSAPTGGTMGFTSPSRGSLPSIPELKGGMGDALSSMGQNIGNAIQAAIDAPTKLAAAAKMIEQGQKIENNQLQNALLSRQVRSIASNDAKTIPTATQKTNIEGQPASGYVPEYIVPAAFKELSESKKQEFEPNMRGASGMPDPLITYVRTPSGITHKKQKDLNADEFTESPQTWWNYMVHTIGLPNLGMGMPPPFAPEYNQWNPWKQEWQKPKEKPFGDGGFHRRRQMQQHRGRWPSAFSR